MYLTPCSGKTYWRSEFSRANQTLAGHNHEGVGQIFFTCHYTIEILLCINWCQKQSNVKLEHMIKCTSEMVKDDKVWLPLRRGSVHLPPSGMIFCNCACNLAAALCLRRSASRRWSSSGTNSSRIWRATRISLFMQPDPILLTIIYVAYCDFTLECYLILVLNLTVHLEILDTRISFFWVPQVEILRNASLTQIKLIKFKLCYPPRQVENNLILCLPL